MSEATSDSAEATSDSAEETTSPATYTLQQFPETIAVVRLGPGAEVPAWAESSSLFSITATATETSLVCANRSVPNKAQKAGPFTAFAVQGPLDFALTGVLAALLAPLAEAEISIFTISTYDTDWILVPVGDSEKAAEAWRAGGHTVALAVPARPQKQSHARNARMSPDKKPGKKK